MAINKEQETKTKSITVEEFNKELSHLKDLFTEEEILKIADAFATVKKQGKAKAKLVREIVPIRQWINSEYYASRDIHNLYPFWKEKMIEIFERPDDEKVNQVILTGAIGIGKTTFAALLILRRLYELSCYENVRALFNLMGTSRIAFAYLSVTKTQAENSGFSMLKDLIDETPYFKDNFPRRHGLDSMVVFPQENLFVTFGSVLNHFIGLNLIGTVLDEANFFEGRQVDEANMQMNNKVSLIYSQIINRAESRFIVNGVNHSLSILISSSTVESSFTEQMIDKAKDDIHTMVVSPTLWDVKRENYTSGKFFYVYAGGQGVDPFVIQDYRDINHILTVQGFPEIQNRNDLDEIYQVIPYEVQSKLIKVPVEHKQAFQGDIIVALQDLAGYSVSASSKFFNNNTAYTKALDENLSHPFTHENIVLSTTDRPHQEGFLPLYAYLKNGFKFKNPSIPRYMHLDLALTGDSVGISMAHISGFRNLYGEDLIEKHANNHSEENYMDEQVKVPEVTVDFMLEIKPPKKPNQISFAKIRDFIVYLRREMGIQFELITADQFQSAQLLQELGDLNFTAGRLSVDRDTKAYDSLASLYYEGRLKHYNYKKYQFELFSLIRYPAKRKIDHVSKNSKDITDSVAGSVFNAVSALDKTGLRANELFDIYIGINLSEDSKEYREDKAQEVGRGILGLGNIKFL